jgi:predicted acyl esterase
MAGNSWLATTQWYIAAEQPPHLACMAPWEGLGDYYRESICRGGIPDHAFWDVLMDWFCGSPPPACWMIMVSSHLELTNVLIRAESSRGCWQND